MKVADYIAQKLVEEGIRHIFLVTGGGAMHLNDSFGQHPHLQYICFHHEQACSMAAESYARLTGNIALVNVTSGPGSLNALNGVFGAWTDSIPMLRQLHGKGRTRPEDERRPTIMPICSHVPSRGERVMITETSTDYNSVFPGTSAVFCGGLQGFPLVHQVADLPHQSLVTTDDIRRGLPVVVEAGRRHFRFQILYF